MITAQRKESRTVVVVDHEALSRLSNILEKALLTAKATPMSDDDVMLTCDILKALFNLTCGYDERVDYDREESDLLKRICKVLQSLILVKMSTAENKSNIVRLGLLL